MPRVAIVTDSTADLPPGLADEHGIAVVPLSVAFGDDVYRAGIDIDTDRFLALLERAPQLPVTSQPSPEAFASQYRALAADHDAVVSIHLSGNLSGTLQSATLAARDVADEIPVTVVDSGTVSMGLGMLAISAARQARAGASADAIAEAVTDESRRVEIVFMVDSLESLRRGGRIGRAASLLGTVLDLKPTLRLVDGEITPLERTRTRKRAIRNMVDRIRQEPGISRICAAHTGRPADAADLLKQFELLVPREEMYIAAMGPVVATHAGPGVIGLISVRENPTNG
ncbi:MAG TPA: DegV family protein [Thermomicrobiales bacterium]|jgi:DegV family protein with EDD domain|nr:DegV family protein [Thermomicrobiales bacterium]